MGGMMRRVMPGLAVCSAMAALAAGLGRAEQAALGRAWLEPLVLAILLGAAARAIWPLPASWRPGVEAAATRVLEIAVALLGASVSLQAVRAAGPALLAAIMAVVAVAIGAGFLVGRALGLQPRMALLIACGNAICGNSAIAAVAPVIGAAAADVAASIAFTALLGVAVVLALPLAAGALGLSGLGGGVLAGLTVYAVPQVLAATAPLGAVAMQTGTLVKLVRVLMLGPVVLGLSLIARNRGAAQAPAWHRMVPWFIAVFLLLATLRSAGALSPPVVQALGAAAAPLTITSMAGLGLLVDYGAIRSVGLRAALAVVLSLAALCGLALLALRCVL